MLTLAITFKDIVEVAGDSHSTVSRALHDHPPMGVNTKLQIQVLAKEVGDVHNAVAKGLKTSRSHMRAWRYCSPCRRSFPHQNSERNAIDSWPATSLEDHLEVTSTGKRNPKY
jgi:hypothetical protein